MPCYLAETANKSHIDFIENALGECNVFSDVEDILAQDKTFNAIILNSESHQLQINIKTIRRSNHYFLTPIFLDSPIDSLTIVDGVLQNPREAKTQIEAIHALINQLNVTCFDWKSKLLYFLFTRPKLTLRPYKDWLNPYYFYYPLIEYFTNEKVEYWQWINDLLKQNILNKSKLIDQLFCCRNCRSAHLHFSEHCPSCKSINIQATNFLHCFSCGLIAPQEEFVKGDRLICAKCNNQLRHIGDDYDRPLESGLCLDCNNYYMDTVLEVTCMICNKAYPTDNLTKNPIYEYTITEQGRNAILLNSLETLVTIFDRINCISSDYFFATLDWFLGMQRRYPEEVFSLVGMSLPFPSTDIASTFMQHFAEQLRQLVRTTDFVTRLNERCLWMLFPKTDQTKLAFIQSRIQGCIENAPDQLKKNIKLTYYSSSVSLAENESAFLLIAKLNTNL